MTAILPSSAVHCHIMPMRRLLVAVLLSVTACERGPAPIPQLDPKAYDDTITAFHKRRLNAIAGPEGWATLRGLWWLKSGTNRIGTDSADAIVLPSDRSPKIIGDVVVAGDSARFVAAKGVVVRVDSQTITA